MALFEHGSKARREREAPLAARMRPRSFEEFVGQEHIIGPDKVLRRATEADQTPSAIFWGPPGSGKTTLANLIAGLTNSHFEPISAVTSGVADLRRTVDEARERRDLYGQRTILFIDEIHRFNKAQQDVVLPHVENGTFTLIGATTENPSFEVIAPLLSRCRVFSLYQLEDEQVQVIVERALANKERGLGDLNVQLEPEAMQHLVGLSNGDARVALNGLETAAHASKPDGKGAIPIDLDTVQDSLQRRTARYDKGGYQHYDTISAFIKSVRGSSPGRRDLLAGQDDRGRGRPHVHRKETGGPGGGGYRLGGPHGFAAGGGRPAGSPLHWHARGTNSSGRSYRISCGRSQEQLSLRSIEQGYERCA